MNCLLPYLSLLVLLKIQHTHSKLQLHINCKNTLYHTAVKRRPTQKYTDKPTNTFKPQGLFLEGLPDTFIRVGGNK